MVKTKSDSNSNNGVPSPLLPHIDSPEDLRKLDQSQLPQVCAELREFMISQLSVNPGHFASSMGAVELTVALHYVFNTPYDRIVWDVGHQAYGHKILTGRRDRFDTNRRMGGLSGFPNPAESEYDTFTAGHASNSISAALGMAVASEMQHENPRRNVVAVIGDASISTGLAFEGLNNAANTPNNLLIILNDNDMSIDDNVGSLHRYLTQLPTTRGYNRLRYRIYRLLCRMNLISNSRRGVIMRFNNSLKSLLGRQQNIFEGLNIRYFGPFDGHDVGRIVRVLNDIKDMTGPRLLHLRTTKGKGFEPAERDPSTWHAPGKFDATTGKRDTGSSEKKPPKYQEVFGKTLVELARLDDRIVGITAAMLSGTSMSVMAKEMPDRVFDVGIAEGHAVTFAGGLAKEGLRPFVAIYSSFLQRAYDNIIHDVAIQNLPVTFCIDRAGLVGEDGVTHHGVFDPAYLREIPGMVVCSPRDEMQLRDMMYTAAHRTEGPMAIRYPRGTGHNVEWHNEMAPITIGKGELLSDNGNDVALLTIGPLTRQAAEAARRAVADGIGVAHWDMRFFKPLDDGILHEVARRGCPVITVEDAARTGGLGTAVDEWLNDNGYNLPVTRIGIPDEFVTQGTPAQLYKACGMDADAIYDAIVKSVNRTRQV